MADMNERGIAKEVCLRGYMKGKGQDVLNVLTLFFQYHRNEFNACTLGTAP